jgi:uncharacterized membrane protein
MTTTPTRFLSALTVMAALASAGAARAADEPTPAEEPSFKFEKCYGVVKAGKNDCQTATSSCAGTSRRDGQKDAWVYLPEGACAKIVGGAASPNA